MKKSLTKTLVMAMAMVVSAQAFADMGLLAQADQDQALMELGVDLNQTRIEAVQADTVVLKEMLAERLQTLSSLLEGNGDAKIGTVVDTEVEALRTQELSSAVLLRKINDINILINHVQNN